MSGAAAGPVTDEEPGQGWGFAAVWLIMLLVPIWFVLTDDVSPLARGVGLTGLAVFAVAYALCYRNPGLIPLSSTLLRSYAWIVLLALLLGLTVPALGGFATFCVSYLVAVAIFCLPPRHAAVVVPVLLGVTVLTVCVLLPIGAAAAAVLLGVTSSVVVMVGVRWFSSRGDRLTAARQELLVLTERDRLARDVHDVLGHSLTVVSVKAQLADRLLETDPARARQELQDVQRLSREALQEIRSTVAQLRSADLAEELEAARTALAAAGVTAAVRGGSPDVAPDCRPLFAWVVREAVTNVVRHAGAERCWIGLGARSLSVGDDGTGTVVEGHGLRGVRERVSQAGGELVLGGREGGGTLLEVRC